MTDKKTTKPDEPADDEHVLSSSDLDPNVGLTAEQKVELAEQHPRPEDFTDEQVAVADRRPEAGSHPLPDGHTGEAPNQPGVLTPDQGGNPPA